ncbi:MAG: GcrA cell cycle regulator [Phenylobacterium sp.]|nr:GcrA cell cycle regulator [Phenylobacterium sp.]
MPWTDAQIALLTQLWTQGVSASGIAAELGDVSRSAVLGKLHRLKLLKSRQAASAPRRYEGEPAVGGPVPVRTGSSAAGPGPSSTVPPQPPRSPWKTSVFRPLAGTAPRPWLCREAGECAFPVDGDGEAVVACCAPAGFRSAYCPAHHAIVFRPAAPMAAPAEPPQAAARPGRWAA